MNPSKQSIVSKLHYLAVICGLFLLMPVVIAAENTINVLITVQNPPYVIDIEDNQGIDLEIIALVHKEMGYETKFIQGHFRRQDEMYNDKSVHALASWFNSKTDNCYTSKPYRFWHNAIMVPKDSPLRDVGGLKDKTLATFHGAVDVLDGFKDIKEVNKSVKIAEDSLQAARMIKGKRADAYLGDYVGYYYALRDHYSTEMAEMYSRVIHFYDKNEQLICYKNPELTRQFNNAFERLQKADKLAAITAQYVRLPNYNN